MKGRRIGDFKWGLSERWDVLGEGVKSRWRGMSFRGFVIFWGKTQNQLARLLGTSFKAIQSFEQGWRNVPAHTERQLLLLLA